MITTYAQFHQLEIHVFVAIWGTHLYLHHDGASDAYLILKEHYPESQIALKEYFVVMYLNQANRVIGVQKLSEGGLI